MEETLLEQGSAQGFTVRTGTVEGPLELILELIERRKLLVNELSLSQVTDDFIAHVKNGEGFPMEDAANFVNVAATLLLIKSRSLLPDLELSHEEEEDVEGLKKRLALYEVARRAARDLEKLFGRSVMYARGDREPDAVFAPSRDLSKETLLTALETLLASKEKEVVLPEARIRPMVSIEEMMDRLRERVERAFTLSFSEFAGTKVEKVEIIVSFLALLELVKQGAMEAEQFGKWGDIRITNTSASVPRY